MEDIKAKIMNDIKVELSDEFDRNFERKGFFANKWQPRSLYTTRGSLLLVTGNLRRSIQARVEGSRIIFSSNVPYASVHNEGLRAGRGAGFVMPKRQFIGNSTEVTDIVRRVADKGVENIAELIRGELQKGKKKR